MTRSPTLFIALVASLSGACADEAVSLTVDAVDAGTSLRCGDTVTAGNASGRIADLKWFLSSPRAVVDGEEVELTFVEDGAWQLSDIALIDLEDASADCAAQGSERTNDQLVFDAESAKTLRKADGLVFNLGVPFNRNHKDPAAEAPPMNDPTTFWAWQSGYKFLRLDLKLDGTGEGPTGWNLHLGSTGCVSDGATVAPSVECSRPNRARIALDYDGPDQVLALDVGALVAGSDFTTNAPDSPPGCMANPKDVGDCEVVFSKLGLNFETGACVDECNDQVAFALE